MGENEAAEDTDVPVIAILKRHLEASVHYHQVASKTGNPEGYAYVKIPDWEVRQIVEFLERATTVANNMREVLAWIVGQQHLFFAECSQAEEIVSRCKEAISDNDQAKNKP